MSVDNVIKKDTVFTVLQGRIQSGEYAGGSKLPGELSLAKELAVGRVTLRAALERLDKAGLIIRYPGKGTFVADSKTVDSRKKKILLLVESNYGSIESPSNYIIPSIERNSECRGIETDIIFLDLIRSLTPEHAVKMLKKAGYTGIILNASYYVGNEPELPILKALDIPVVIPHAMPQDQAVTGFAVIHTDKKQAWQDGVEYLLGAGHQRILSLGSINSKGVCDLRGFEAKEYLDFLARIGADPAPELLQFIPAEFPGLTKLLSDLLHGDLPPTAVICYSFVFAKHVYDSLRSLSIAIPDQLSVLSCCVFPGAELMQPPMSIIDFNYKNIGKKAVELIDRANEWFKSDNNELPNIINPHNLVIRESINVSNK